MKGGVRGEICYQQEPRSVVVIISCNYDNYYYSEHLYSSTYRLQRWSVDGSTSQTEKN